ncbi:MAG: hypothetical protein KF819_40945 [Labilithrix sp.]|nr:hypothetical protein [Labilithrix sp.]
MVSRRGHRLASSLFVLAVAGSTAACAAIFGFERLSEEGGDGGPPDGTAPDDASDEVVDKGCGELGVTPPPPAQDAGEDALEPFSVAVDLLDFGIDFNAAQPGFNLDLTCSPTVETSTCVVADPSRYADYAADRNDGRGLDNVSFNLLKYLGGFGDGFKPSTINERLKAGEYGLVIRIARWNGQANDEDVLVEVFPAIGVRTLDDAGVRGDAGKPALTSDDQWQRDARFAVAPGVDGSKGKSGLGYVRDMRVVARFPAVTMAIAVPDDPKPLDIAILEGWLDAKLEVTSEGLWRLTDGMVGGRWRTKDFLEQVRQIYVKDSQGIRDKYLCNPGAPTLVYNLAKTEVCFSRDLRSTSLEDKKGLPCDAFSVGLRFSTYALKDEGPLVDLPPIPERCTGAGDLPPGDECRPPD